jgi:hypothetical protein
MLMGGELALPAPAGPITKTPNLLIVAKLGEGIVCIVADFQVIKQDTCTFAFSPSSLLEDSQKIKKD